MATKKAAATTEKAVETKTTTKKPAAKKTTAKKDMKVKTVIEYYGKQVDEKDVIASVKKVWTKKGNKIGDIKTMELYIKPEEGKAYFVVNGLANGNYFINLSRHSV